MLFCCKVGDGSTNAQSQKCTPFVSMYSDCTEENRCTGCNRCTCSSQGLWECKTFTEDCEEQHDEDTDVIDEKLINAALNKMLIELQSKPEPKEFKELHYVPQPLPPESPLSPETIIGYLIGIPGEKH